MPNQANASRATRETPSFRRVNMRRPSARSGLRTGGRSAPRREPRRASAADAADPLRHPVWMQRRPAPTPSEAFGTGQHWKIRPAWRVPILGPSVEDVKFFGRSPTRGEPASFARRVPSREGSGTEGVIAAKLRCREVALYTL